MLSAEFLLSDEFRFDTGVTAILVDTCLRHSPRVPAPLYVFPFLSSVSVLPAGEKNNNDLVTGHFEADLAHAQLI